jgi:thermitase
MTRSKKLVGALAAIAIVSVTLGLATAAGASTAPNDPYYPRQWGLTRINGPAAWSFGTGKGIVVADIDTGVDYRNGDIRPNLVPGYGHDFLSNDNDPMDPNGHGTMTAGVIGAVTNNRMGVAGVAPNVKIMSLRACSLAGEETCDTNAIANAISYAVAHGANVINMSLGGIAPGPESVQAIAAAAQGVLVVAAAGNAATPVCSFPGAAPGVLCVGATDPFDRLASFSNYGVRLDVVAPGVQIWSTNRYPINYASEDGTSFASPMVAGIGALLMSMGANSVLAGLIIRETAKDLGLPGYDLTYGFGRVDALAAVKLCKQIC